MVLTLPRVLVQELQCMCGMHVLSRLRRVLSNDEVCAVQLRVRCALGYVTEGAFHRGGDILARFWSFVSSSRMAVSER